MWFPMLEYQLYKESKQQQQQKTTAVDRSKVKMLNFKLQFKFKF